jgi:hypothetical protein
MSRLAIALVLVLAVTSVNTQDAESEQSQAPAVGASWCECARQLCAGTQPGLTMVTDDCPRKPPSLSNKLVNRASDLGYRIRFG